jgi:hypothetical protein
VLYCIVRQRWGTARCTSCRYSDAGPRYGRTVAYFEVLCCTVSYGSSVGPHPPPSVVRPPLSALRSPLSAVRCDAATRAPSEQAHALCDRVRSACTPRQPEPYALWRRTSYCRQAMTTWNTCNACVWVTGWRSHVQHRPTMIKRTRLLSQCRADAGLVLTSLAYSCS